RNSHRARRTRTSQADISSPKACLTNAARSKERRVRDSRRLQLHQTSRLPHYPPSDRDLRRNCASIGINLATTVKRESGPDTGVRGGDTGMAGGPRSEEHTSELQSRVDLVCRLLLEKKK